MSLLLFATAALTLVPAPDAIRPDLGKDRITATLRISKFSECVAHSRERDIVALLSTPYGSYDELRALLTTVRTDTDCDLSGAKSIQVSPVHMMGSILESYYHQHLEAKAFFFQPQSDGWIVLPLNDIRLKDLEPFSKMSNLGACVSFRNPRGVIALLNTKPLTNGELAAIKALDSTIASCAVSGSDLAPTQQELRAAITTGLVNRIQNRSIPVHNKAGEH